MGWRISHILDDYAREAVLGYPVQPLETGIPTTGKALLTVGEPEKKRQVVLKCSANPRLEWVSMVHPMAVVSPHASLAEGSFIGPFVTAADISLHPHVTLLPYSLLGAKVSIGAYSSISSHCSIHSEVQIGEETIIGSGAQITAGVRIGNRCRIAPNAVVNRDIPDDHMAVTPSQTRILPVRRSPG